MQAAPRLKLLVTSRARLNLQAEYLYPLAGIDFPQDAPVLLPAARQSSAVQLFVQSARRVQDDFALSNDNVAAVGGLCRLVEGMPLAILLAAAWVEMLPPAQILAQVSHPFDFLATDLRDVPDRQRSLRAVFDHSWRLLRAPEQTLFTQLSSFRTGFTQEAMQAVTGSSPPTLLALVRMSLVRRQAALDPVVFKRARHVITENRRTVEAAEAFAAGDLIALGRLMRASHASMRDDFGITTPDIDRLADMMSAAIG
ncbi:MAG: hypothetical protein HC933_06940, partial [Pleurocapsa sp. SU_196_0]|nr:hypothetical protein [Pleurocapsa sp. SU_196_0]